ncbi:hypothetical protein F2Q70_00021056 [Brassica cretica]|uniref:Uncharacterized protein n=2 Tax=Brassica cretica TaxID=69181 RepID=A0A3N6PMA5_BRACR|nr:hypothetical protein F2Q70_00021056 [Brassica cretica]KAF2559677.1 hypothetical protein F2Q68_00014539 [Brassica cretica]KAF3607361.1 hypothetical protein DY000_02047043 [Brassica cretica]
MAGTDGKHVVCCSEHEASMCFSEHGGTLLMSWRSWTEPRRRVVDVLQQKKSLDLEAGSRRQDPDPGAGPWKSEAGP